MAITNNVVCIDFSVKQILFYAWKFFRLFGETSWYQRRLSISFLSERDETSGNVATLFRTKQWGVLLFRDIPPVFLQVGAINETPAIIFARIPRIVTARHRFWHDPLRYRCGESTLGIVLKPIKAPEIITITFRRYRRRCKLYGLFSREITAVRFAFPFLKEAEDALKGMVASIRRNNFAMEECWVFWENVARNIKIIENIV